MPSQLSPVQRRQFYIDTYGGYRTQKKSKGFHTWASCPSGNRIIEKNLTPEQPAGRKECDTCSYHRIVEERSG